MRKSNWALAVVLLAVMVFGNVAIAEPVVIVGTVNDDYQVITDDEHVYDIGLGEMSEKLTEEIGKKVEVKGELETDEDGFKMIHVNSYKIIVENPGE